MSLKAKLTTTIAALCMVICLLSVGVWAATQATVNFNGTVSFQLKDVQVSVYGAYKGTATELGSAASDAIVDNSADDDDTNDANNDKHIVTWDASNEDSDADPNGADGMLDAEWELTDLDFAAKDSEIVIVIKVKNNNPDNGVIATFTPSVAGVALTTDYVEDLGDANVSAKYEIVGETDGEIAVGATACYKIYIKVTNRNLQVNKATVSGSLLLQDAVAHPAP